MWWQATGWVWFWLAGAQCALIAQTPAPPGTNGLPATLTLAEARRRAWERNWDLLAAKNDVDQSTAQQIIAREFPNPTLGLSSSQISFDSHPNSTRAGNGLFNRSYDTMAAISQLFEIGGKRASRQASALAGLESARDRLMDARRVLDHAVDKTFITALLAHENVQILLQSTDLLRQEAKIAAVRLQAGDISQADKSQIEITAERFEQDAKSAQAAERAAWIALDVLMGEPNPSGLWVPGDTLDKLASLPFLASELPPGPKRPDLAAAEAARRKAEADLRLQKAMRVPDPTLSLLYERQPPDLPNTIGIGVSFPLPLWNRNKGAIRAAQAAEEAAALQTDRLRAQIAAEVAGARVAYTNAATRFEQYRGQIQPKSAEIRQTLSFAYEKGGASLVDLLIAQRNDNEVRLATVQAAADLATAVADLKAALNLNPTAGSP